MFAEGRKFRVIHGGILMSKRWKQLITIGGVTVALSGVSLQ
jgi:hypothetical protein